MPSSGCSRPVAGSAPSSRTHRAPGTPATCTPRPVRTAAFHTALFGWQVVESGWATAIQVPGCGDHLEVIVDPDIATRQARAPEGFADVIGSVSPGATAQWHVTFTVADRDAAAATTQRLGGTVLAGAEDDWTRSARIRDPQDGVLTLSQFAPTTSGD